MISKYFSQRPVGQINLKAIIPWSNDLAKRSETYSAFLARKGVKNPTKISLKEIQKSFTHLSDCFSFRTGRMTSEGEEFVSDIIADLDLFGKDAKIDDIINMSKLHDAKKIGENINISI